ncbi:MAG: serine--tRNA ligase, partial [Actinobacteria bacterium]
MLDVSLLRTEAAALAAAMRRRGVDLDIDSLTGLDEERRRLRVEAEGLRARQKELGKTIPTLDGGDKQRAIAEAAA